MKQQYDLAIVSALKLERKHLQRLLVARKREPDFAFPLISGFLKTSRECRTCLIQCGIGAEQAAGNLSDFLEQVKVGHLLIAGLCGSLTERFRVGDLFIPHELLSAEKGSVIPCDSGFNSREADHSAETLLSVNTPITAASSRKQWHEKTGAACVDMESYALAEVARQRGVHFSVIRAVSDDTRSELDPRLINLLNVSGEPDHWNILCNLCRYPQLLPRLFPMFSRANLAMNSITTYLKRKTMPQQPDCAGGL